MFPERTVGLVRQVHHAGARLFAQGVFGGKEQRPFQRMTEHRQMADPDRLPGPLPRRLVVQYPAEHVVGGPGDIIVQAGDMGIEQQARLALAFQQER